MKTVDELLQLSKEEREAYLAMLPRDEAADIRKQIASIAINYATNISTPLHANGVPAQTSVAAPSPNPTQVAPAPNPTQVAPAVTSMNPTAPVIPKINIGETDDQKDAKSKQADFAINSTLEATQKAAGMGSIVGGLMDANMTRNPSEATAGGGALSGALKGAGAGAVGGPIGMIGGAIFGALSGAIKQGNARTNYEEEERLKREAELNGRRIAPTTMEKGGAVVETDMETGLIPTRTEKGEEMLLPDGKLVSVMAETKHKDQKKDEITDIIPNGAYVFSDSPKKLIDLAKISDDTYGYNPGEYKEEGNEKMYRITIGDMLGKKGKITPAEAIRKIRKMYSVDENAKEYFENVTNEMNKKNRINAVQLIMQLQEGVYEPIKNENAKVFELGGGACPEGQAWSASQQKCVTYDELRQNQADYDAYLASFSAGSQAKLDDVKKVDEVTSKPLDQSFLEKTNKDIADLAIQLDNVVPNKDGLLSPLPSKTASILSSVPTVTPAVNSTPPRLPLVNTASAVAALQSQVSPVTNQTVSQKQNPLAPIPSLAPNATNNPASIPKKERTTVSLDPIKDLLGQQSIDNKDSYSKSVESANDLYSRQKSRNLSSLFTQSIGIASQNPNVTPTIRSANYVDEKNPRIQESEIQAQLNESTKQTNRYIDSLASSGANPAAMAGAVAEIRDKEMDQENKVRSNALTANKNADARKYAELSNIVDANKKEITGAENATRSNVNKLIGSLTDATTGFIRADGQLDTSNTTKLQQLDAWYNANKQTLNQGEIDVYMKTKEQIIKKEQNDKIADYMKQLAGKAIM